MLFRSPWARRLASEGVAAAVRGSEPLALAANSIGGTLTCEAVARDFGMDWSPAVEAVGALA